jgi:nucleosome binding factor SPN SPT16 subunit
VLQKDKSKDNIAYKTADRFPRDKAKSLKILVDKRHEAVILPIFGIATPFHISVIKNLSQTDEDGYSLLRINFVTPGIKNIKTGAGGTSYLKEITYRSQSSASLATAQRLIKEAQKRYKQLENERKEMEVWTCR